MGIMPADRDQKWQRVFRRFGLPGEATGQDHDAPNRDAPKSTQPDSGRRDRAQKPNEPNKRG